MQLIPSFGKMMPSHSWRILMLFQTDEGLELSGNDITFTLFLTYAHQSRCHSACQRPRVYFSGDKLEENLIFNRTPLLRCHSHIICLERIIDFFSILTKLYNHHHNRLQNTFIIPKGNLFPLMVTFHSSLPNPRQPLVHSESLSISGYLI